MLAKSLPYKINFQLPPPWSSSDSGSSDAESSLPNPSPRDVTGPVIPFPYLHRGQHRHLLQLIQKEALQSIAIECLIFSKEVFKQAVSSMNGLVLSPINCTILSCTNPSSSITTSLSPIVERTRVPRRYVIMELASDDDSLIPYEGSDKESATGDVNRIPAEHGEVPCNDDCLNPDTIDLSDLAKAIVSAKDDTNVSEEETLLILNSTVNTKQYEITQRGVEACFFDTLEKFGGATLKPLTMFALDGFKKNEYFT